MTTPIAQTINDTAVIVKFIEEAKDYLDNAEERYLNFDQNTLEQISKQHAKNIFITSKHLNILKGIEDVLKTKSKQTEAKYWKKYNEQYARALSTKDIQVYISGEEEMVKWAELELEVQFIKRQLEALHDALKDMGWQIKNVTEIRINQLQDVLL